MLACGIVLVFTGVWKAACGCWNCNRSFDSSSFSPVDYVMLIACAFLFTYLAKSALS